VAEPAIRSSVERAFFGLLDELPEALRVQLEAHTRPEYYRAAANAPMLGWVPLSHAVGLRESLRTLIADDDRFVTLMKDWALLSTERPPFNVIAAAILRIYSRAPNTLLRAHCRVWTTIYRNVGQYTATELDEHSAMVVLQSTCPEARAEAFRLYTLGVLRAVVELGGARSLPGTHRLADDRIEFVLRWQP